MFNWADNIPNEEEKKYFLFALDQVKNKSNPRILEIGTYTGTSIMSMKGYIPHAECLVIDNWNMEDAELRACSRIAGLELTMDMIFQAFLENTQGIVKYIKQDSTLALIDLVENKEKFDFIYVDGSHRSGDTLLDLSYAWVLLDKGGILAIDDYHFIPSINPEDRPKLAIDLFLTKLSSRYIVIYQKYRIFIRKI